MAETIGGFFDAWELFMHPTLAGTVAGALLGFLGVYVVLRRLVFLSAAVSQAAGLGVALTFYARLHLGVPALVARPTLGAALLTLLAVLPVALERGRPSVRRDSILGFGFLVGAAGTLALGTRIIEEVHDIDELLFGSAVAVLPEDFSIIVTMSLLLLLLHVWWVRGFVSVSFDPEGAAVRGLPVRILDLTLFATLALAISVSTRVLGALPTFGFTVLPAMAAVRLSPSVFVSLILATLLGAASGFVGYLVAYLYKLPVGASQTLIGACFVLLAEAIHRFRLTVAQPRR